jgi:hypothetical protein
MIICLVDLHSLQRDICQVLIYVGVLNAGVKECSVGDVLFLYAIRYVHNVQNRAWFFCFVL